jgi:cytochrome P450
MADRFDPSSPQFVAYPYDAYARLRDESPVTWHEPTRQWLISRYADVNALLRDRRLGRTYLHVGSHADFGHEPDPPHLGPFWHLQRSGMLDMEPPAHTRVRRLVAKAFTPRRVEALRPAIRRIASGLADDLLAAGGGDLIKQYAEPLPVTVIAELLGVPDQDRPLLRPWSADICGMFELNPTREAADRAVRASEEFSAYLRRLAAIRRADPQDDLISALAHVVDGGDTLTEDELVGTCALLLNAGHEATVNVTGNGWRALLHHPDQLGLLRDAVLREDRTLLPLAVEELMRFDTPLQMFERWVLEDIAVGGVDIPRGAELALLFGSANHDPAVFVDPARLDVTRADNPHLSFGAGIHFCLGAPLARIELVESYGVLLGRGPLPVLEVEPRFRPGYIIRGLESLQVSFA